MEEADKRRAMFGMPRVDFLNEASVSPLMADRYARIMMDLRSFASERRFPDPLHEPRSQSLDVTLRAYVSKLFWDGRCFREALAALAAVGASVSRHVGKAMPLTRQALAGRLEPEWGRLPLPSQVAAAAANWMKQRGRSRAAVAVALMMCCYLRPGEMALLQARQLIPPADTSGLRNWSVAPHPRELGRASKTGAFDDNIPLDLRHMTWLSEVLERLKKKLKPNERLGRDAAVFLERVPAGGEDGRRRQPRRPGPLPVEAHRRVGGLVDAEPPGRGHQAARQVVHRPHSDAVLPGREARRAVARAKSRRESACRSVRSCDA